MLCTHASPACLPARPPAHAPCICTYFCTLSSKPRISASLSSSSSSAAPAARQAAGGQAREQADRQRFSRAQGLGFRVVSRAQVAATAAADGSRQRPPPTLPRMQAAGMPGMHHRDTNPHNHGCNNAASAMASQQSPPPAHTRTHTDRTDNSRWFSSLYSSASAKAARTQEGTACSSPSTAWFQSSASTASISSLYRTDTAYLQAVRQEGGGGGRGWISSASHWNPPGTAQVPGRGSNALTAK